MSTQIDVLSEIFRAFGYLFAAGAAYFSYYFGKKGIGKQLNLPFGFTETAYNESETRKDVLTRLVKGTGVILAVAWVLGYALLGTSSDCSDSSDPVYGACNAVQNFVPSSSEKFGTFIFFTVLLLVPFIMGIQSKLSLVGKGIISGKK